MSSDPFTALLEGAARRGGRGSDIPAAISRELEAGDLQLLSEPGNVKPISIKNLKQSHHQLARLVAQGEKPAVISEITGYSTSRIAVLQSDPQFHELVVHYTELEQEEHSRSRADFHERLAALGFDSIETLHERVVDDPDSFTNKELLSIVEATADRTGHGKTQTVNQNNVNVSLTAQELAALRSNIGGAAIEGASYTFTEEDRGTLLRLASRATETHPSDEEAEGSAGEGAPV